MRTGSHSGADDIFRKGSVHPEGKNKTQGGRGGLPFNVVDGLTLPMMMYHPHPCPPPLIFVASGDMALLYVSIVAMTSGHYPVLVILVVMYMCV